MQENQRDYDKEPLIIENKTQFFIAFLGICVFIFMIFMFLYNPNEVRFRQLFIIFPIFGMPFILNYFFNKNKKAHIEFLNNKIIYNIDNKPLKIIFLDDILYIKRTYFIRDRKWLENKNSFYKFILKYDPYTTILAFFASCFIVVLIVNRYFFIDSYRITIILFATLFLFAFCKFLYFCIFKAEIRLIFYDHIVIYDNHKNINFIIPSNYDYKLLRDFFIKKKNIDIKKAECHIWLDDK